MTEPSSACPAVALPVALPRLHPWWTQAWLQWRRSLDRLRLAACVALAGATLASILALAGNAPMARVVFEHRQLGALAVGVVLFLLLRLPIANAARTLRFGWMAALPLPPRTARRTLLLVTLALGVLALAWLAISLGGLGASLGMAAFAGVLGHVFVGVVAACVALVWIAHRAWQRPAALPVRPGIRVPLLSLGWLEDPDLPFLVAWQNRECTRQWRISGGAKPVAVVLLLFPGSESPGIFFGLVAGALIIAWHRCLLQSSLRVVGHAASLSRRWPMPGAVVARALLRFPLLGSVLALVALFTAVVLTMQPPLAALVGSFLALALASPLTLTRLVVRFRNLTQ